MELRSKTIDASELHGLCKLASDAIYAGNVVVQCEDIRTTRDGMNVVRWTLKVNQSKEKGAHRSASGRRTVSACWHAHRDVMREIFRADPHARVSSAMARYDGAESFITRFPSTYYRNAGSLMSPVLYGTLCDCGGPR